MSTTSTACNLINGERSDTGSVHELGRRPAGSQAELGQHSLL